MLIWKFKSRLKVFFSFLGSIIYSSDFWGANLKHPFSYISIHSFHSNLWSESLTLVPRIWRNNKFSLTMPKKNIIRLWVIPISIAGWVYSFLGMRESVAGLDCIMSQRFPENSFVHPFLQHFIKLQLYCVGTQSVKGTDN